MISNPKYGWCIFNIEDFEGHPSYLTDVPMELLDGFIDFFYNKKDVCISFDEEGSEFYLILTFSNGVYIIEEKEESKLIQINKRVLDLAKELIEDISIDFEGWAKEFSIIPEENINRRIILFNNKIKKLRTALKGVIL